MTTLPVAGICARCGTTVRNREPYTQVEAVVWEKITRSGRTVTSRKTTGRVLCRSCPPIEDGTAALLFDV